MNLLYDVLKLGAFKEDLFQWTLIIDCYTEMPKENNDIPKSNHGEKSMKILFIINADMEYLLKRIDTCHNNPKKS